MKETPTYRTRFHALLGRGGLLLALVLACAASAFAQNRYPVERCQDEIRFRIQRDRDSQLNVSFRSADDYFISNAETGVRGRGNAQGSAFSYDCRINVKYRGLSDATYKFIGDGDGGGTSVPSWLVGVFRGRNPEGRQQATVTVNASGHVSAAFDDGTRDEGYYNGNAIRFGPGLAWAVERSEDGFSAQSNRRTEQFRRASDGGGGGPWRVPRWAVGTFRGTTSNGEAELRIGADGTATARSVSTNQTFTGNYSNGVLRFDWGSFNLIRDGDDIRTVEINNRDNQTTYRRTSGY